MANTKVPLVGRLQGSLCIELHTADACKLLLGHTHYLKKKHTKNEKENGKNNEVKKIKKVKVSDGVFSFAYRMGQVWAAAAQDDPYADWYLLKTYDQLVQVRHQLAEIIDRYQATLTQHYGEFHYTFLSQTPLKKTLWFKTPYGYLAAKLVVQLDQLLLLVLAAERMGVLLDQPFELIKQTWIEKTRRVLTLPTQWQPFLITRHDITHHTEMALKAQKIMGECPEPILMKTVRAPFAPIIHSIHSERG